MLNWIFSTIYLFLNYLEGRWYRKDFVFILFLHDEKRKLLLKEPTMAGSRRPVKSKRHEERNEQTNGTSNQSMRWWVLFGSASSSSVGELSLTDPLMEYVRLTSWNRKELFPFHFDHRPDSGFQQIRGENAEEFWCVQFSVVGSWHFDDVILATRARSCSLVLIAGAAASLKEQKWVDSCTASLVYAATYLCVVPILSVVTINGLPFQS